MSFSVSLFQAILVFSMVFAGAAALFVGGRGRILQDLKFLTQRGWKESAARRQGLVMIGPDGEMAANHGAKLMFGGFSGAAPTRRALLDRIKDAGKGAAGRHEFEQALSKLSTAGAAFTLQVETKSGKRLDVIGEPRGASVSLALHDVTELYQRMTEAEAQVAAKIDEAQLLASALEAADIASARIDATGEVTWASSAMQRLPTAKAEALAAAAAPLKVRTGANRRSEEVTIEDASYHLDAAQAPGGGRIITATPVQEGSGGDAAFSRFVNTMAATFAHLKVSLMIFDQQHRLTLFNPATIELFGGDPAWFARRPTIAEILDAMRETRAVPEQADFIKWRDDLLSQLTGDDAPDYVEDWHLPDGRTIHVIARPHPSGGLAVTAEDITANVDLLRNTATDKAVMLATTDFLDEALIVFGPDGLSRVANAAFMRLWQFPSEAFAEPKHISEVADHCAALCEGGGYWAMVQDRVTTGAGRRKAREKFTLSSGAVVQGRYSPMPDGSSLLVMGDITASENIATALRERNDALEHADEIRGALVDQISHQMRTPLNAVFGFSQLLGDDRFGALTDRQREYVDGISTSSRELLDAINGMTDLINVGSDSMSLEGETLDPFDTTREVIDLAARRFESRGVSIKLAKTGEIGPFVAHRVRLRQIIFNLLMDALTKSADNTVIRLGMGLGQRNLHISVSHQAVDPSGDAGLALSLVRRFASLHDGLVEVEQDENGMRQVRCALPECAPYDLTSETSELPLAAETISR